MHVVKLTGDLFPIFAKLQYLKTQLAMRYPELRGKFEKFKWSKNGLTYGRFGVLRITTFL